MACFKVRDLEDTEVANELATSFAPIFQASKNENIIAIAKMKSNWCMYGILAVVDFELGRRMWSGLELT